MLKLFCHTCHKFIKEVEPIKAGKFTGEEICRDCRDVMDSALNEIKKISHRAQFAIKKKEDKAVADLELAIAKALKRE